MVQYRSKTIFFPFSGCYLNCKDDFRISGIRLKQPEGTVG